jgi:pimeloyl-ACP methyl ester carboxylesterase
MFWTNVKIVAVVLATLGGFTLVANVIPQVESDVPRQITFTPDMEPEELLVIGEAGHFVWEDAPERCAEAVTAFLHRIRGSA